jgi:2-polyprenyl-3-methyl-5-hydroxy-6-metoxy-1,4-benzoquinol methylase
MCPLCSDTARHYARDKKRDYFRCPTCYLIFVPKKFHLPPPLEKSLYDYHQNDPLDAGYRNFLGKIAEPLTKLLKPGMRGLDFGSGPGPTLYLMLKELGFPTDIYDPFYADNPKMLEKQYDFVTCTEVAEHFCDPKGSFDKLTGLVKPKGYLALMTLFWKDGMSFADWWYKNDTTHVAFYSRRTIRWLEKKYGLRALHLDERAVIFQID